MEGRSNTKTEAMNMDEGEKIERRKKLGNVADNGEKEEWERDTVKRKRKK